MLEERLELFEENESDVNAFLVEALAELGAKETAPLIDTKNANCGMWVHEASPGYTACALD